MIEEPKVWQEDCFPQDMDTPIRSMTREARQGSGTAIDAAAQQADVG